MNSDVGDEKESGADTAKADVLRYFERLGREVEIKRQGTVLNEIVDYMCSVGMEGKIWKRVSLFAICGIEKRLKNGKSLRTVCVALKDILERSESSSTSSWKERRFRTFASRLIRMACRDVPQPLSSVQRAHVVSLVRTAIQWKTSVDTSGDADDTSNSLSKVGKPLKFVLRSRDVLLLVRFGRITLDDVGLDAARKYVYEIWPKLIGVSSSKTSIVGALRRLVCDTACRMQNEAFTTMDLKMGWSYENAGRFLLCALRFGIFGPNYFRNAPESHALSIPKWRVIVRRLLKSRSRLANDTGLLLCTEVGLDTTTLLNRDSRSVRSITEGGGGGGGGAGGGEKMEIARNTTTSTTHIFENKTSSLTPAGKSMAISEMHAVVERGKRPNLHPRFVLATLTVDGFVITDTIRALVCDYVMRMLVVSPRLYSLDAAAFVTHLPVDVGKNVDVLKICADTVRTLARVDQKTAKRFARELDRLQTRDGKKVRTFYALFKDSVNSTSPCKSAKTACRKKENSSQIKFDLTRLPKHVEIVNSVDGVKEVAHVLLGSDLACAAFGHDTRSDDSPKLCPPDIVGIDAEWPPNNGPISILQIATRHRVLLFDIDTLVRSDKKKKEGRNDDGDGIHKTALYLRILLDALFGAKSVTYKIGFQLMRSDVPKMIARSILSDSIEIYRVVDVASMFYHSSLYRRLRCPVIKGLKSACEMVLQQTLDKTEQRSDWALRPLRQSQVDYAARDSLCLVDICDTLSKRGDIVDIDRLCIRQISSNEKDRRSIFSHVVMQCGVVIEASRVPKAKKLLKIDVDVGKKTVIHIVSALAVEYNPSSLVGTRVVAVTNLCPYPLCGSVSFGGLLCVYPTPPAGVGCVVRSIELVRPSTCSEVGSRVSLSGSGSDEKGRSPSGKPPGLLDVSAPRNAWASLAPFLTTDTGTGNVTLRLRSGKEIPLECDGGPLAVKTIFGGSFR